MTCLAFFAWKLWFVLCSVPAQSSDRCFVSSCDWFDLICFGRVWLYFLLFVFFSSYSIWFYLVLFHSIGYILFCGFGFFCLALFGLIWFHFFITFVLYISPGQPGGKYCGQPSDGQ